MTIRIEVHQARTILEGPVYRTKTNVTYASGIDSSIFVFDTETQVFSHVASVWDMENYPTNHPDAIAADSLYYRQSSCQKDNNFAVSAAEFAVYTLGRISSLAKAYATATEDFEGEGDYTFTD